MITEFLENFLFKKIPKDNYLYFNKSRFIHFFEYYKKYLRYAFGNFDYFILNNDKDILINIFKRDDKWFKSDHKLEPVELDFGSIPYSTGNLDHKNLFKNKAVVLSLPQSAILGRTVRIPRRFASKLSKALDGDLTLKTPIPLSEILSGFAVIDVQDSSLIVRQWVVRRSELDVIKPYLAETQSVFITTDPRPEDNGHKPTIIVSKMALDIKGKSEFRPVRTLTYTALLVACMLIVSSVQSRWQEDSDMSAEWTALQPMLQASRDRHTKQNIIISGIKRAISLKTASVPITVELEHLSVAIPAHTWLTELTTERTSDSGNQIKINGFSGNVPDLVKSLDGAGWFKETRLLGAITRDPVEEVDRFSLVTQSLVKKGN